MKLRTTLLLSAALLVAAPAANAGDRNPFGDGSLPDILKPFDVDGDGRLSEEERQAFVAAVRAGEVAHPPARPDRPDRPHGNPWDTDGDGVLSDAEKAAAQEAIRARILEQRGRRFDELDDDDDGFLSLEELQDIPGIGRHAERLLAHLDKDGDGKVSKEEFLGSIRPPRPDVPPPPRPDEPPVRPGDPVAR